jgi:hypothetical protein
MRLIFFWHRSQTMDPSFSIVEPVPVAGGPAATTPVAYFTPAGAPAGAGNPRAVKSRGIITS